MKKIYRILPVILCAGVLPLHAAEEQTALLDHFEKALIDVMANFEVVHDGTVSSETRKTFDKQLAELLSSAASLQRVVDGLGIGTDVNPDQHAKQVSSAFRSSSGTPLTLANPTKSNAKKNNGTSLSDKLHDIGTVSGVNTPANRAGLAFRNLNNDLQVLREMDLRSEDGRYTIAEKNRQLLPYLEFQRDYMYFRMSYPNMNDLCRDRNWVNDLEKRLLRMRSLASTIQPVFRAYCPDEAAKISLSAEVERLSLVCQAITREATSLNAGGSGSNGMKTILDNSKIGNSGGSGMINFKSSTMNQSQKNIKDNKQTTAAVEDTAPEYTKNAEKAFTNLLTYFEAMDQIDWDVYAFSAKKAKKVPSATTSGKSSGASSGKSGTTKKGSAKVDTDDVVEVTGDSDMQWK